MDHSLPWTVIYVDDEQFNLDELKDKLAPRLANPIRLFNHAQDFIHWISTTTERVGALMVDLIMPNMSGLELIEWCRKHRPDLRPLIIVTGMQDKYSREQAREAGADAYLIKPVSIGTFLTALTELEHNRFEVHKSDTAAPPASEIEIAPLTVVPLRKRASRT
jgi:DNA-binding response OmpR family regulator